MNELDRYAVSLENMEVFRAQVEVQAREIERIDAGAKKIATYAVSLEQELAALKAQPSGVVLPLMAALKSVVHDNRAPNEVSQECAAVLIEVARLNQPASAGKFTLGDRVRKTKGSQWHGTVVGTYSTALTPEGYAVESSTEIGSVQIYPAAALEACE